MSSLDPGLRPNSAIYLGSDQPHLISTSGHPTSPDPLDEPLELYNPSTPLSQITRLAAQLPSPPHTNSTSGSQGDKDSKDSGSIRRLGLPVVNVDAGSDPEDRLANRKRMQNEDSRDDYDDSRLSRSRDPSPDKQTSRIAPRLDRTASYGSESRGVSKLDRYHALALRSPSGSSTSNLPTGMSPKGRTISLGRSGGAAAVAAMASTNGALTGSMRHASLTLPPQRGGISDVFDLDTGEMSRRAINDLGLSHSHSHTNSSTSITHSNSSGSIRMPRSGSGSSIPTHSHSSPNSTSEDDRSTTPPAPRTPQMRVVEVSPGRTIEISPRQRLVSEPTSPRRLSLLRHEVNTSIGSSRRGARERLNTVDEDRNDRLANGKKSRGGIPAEFLENRSPPMDEDPMDALTLTLPPRRPPSSMDRQPSPGLYTSNGSPSLEDAPATLTSPFGTLSSEVSRGSQSDTVGSGRLAGLGATGRRPRPAGLKSRVDRWGESDEAWEKRQMGDETDQDSTIGSIAQRRVQTDVDTASRRPGVRSVVNETLKSVGLVRSSTTTASVRRLREALEESPGGRSRTVSDARITIGGQDSLVSSPTKFSHRDSARASESVDLSRTGSTRLSTRDRSKSRMSMDDREDGSMSALERYGSGRNLLLSPHVRPPITIHNTLSGIHTGDSPAVGNRDLPGERRREGLDLRRDTLTDGRETPANLRAFQRNYNHAGPKAYTSPSGTQRSLPPRPSTSTGADLHHNGGGHAHHVSTLSTGNVNLLSAPQITSAGGSSTGTRSIAGDASISGMAMSNGTNSPGGNPTQLLNDALYMFESHVSKLPHASTMPDTYHDVMRDAKSIVNAAIALSNGLRAANNVCLEEMVEAEANSPSKTSPQKGSIDPGEVADVWKRVEAEFRADVKVSDELVRALTSFMIGAGRMLRSASSISANSAASHSRMMSMGGDGSVSRTGTMSRTESRVSGVVSRSESRTGSISRGVSMSRGGGGSSDGRRSVEGWTHGLSRGSIDGRKSIESPYIGERRSAETHREDALRRLTGTDTASQGSGGGSAGSRDRSNRVSFQVHEHGGSRPGTSLSMIRDSIREDGSPGPKTFTGLSSRRSVGMHTPASGQKSLPPLPMPPPGDVLSFPQMEDGGDRTPIELPRPHVRHSTMPALAVPPPLPTLPSESLIRRAETISRHQATNSITSTTTASTTKAKLPSSHATVRATSIVPAPTSTPTTAITPTTARPRDITVTRSPENSFSKSSGQSAAVNGLQQVALANPPRKRTISTTDDEQAFQSGSGSDSRALLPSRSSTSITNKTTSPPSALSTVAERRVGTRPLVNRRTSSSVSGASSHTINASSIARSETPTSRRLVQRMSSAGTLNSASPSPSTNNSRTSLSFAAAGSERGDDSGRATDSGAEDRRLRRTSNRLSLNAALTRPHLSDLLRRRRGEDDGVEGGESPSSSAKERRERRLAGQS